MILRYTKIQEFLPLLEIKGIDELLLSPREICDIDAFFVQLKDFESVSKSLQKGDVTLSDVRDLFDAISENDPSCAEKLAPDAQIVEDSLRDCKNSTR
jgi:hypothetical protein